MQLAVFAIILTFVYGLHASRGDRDEALGDASSDFAQRLLQEVARDKKSMVLSPLSIHASLSMALAGARNETAEEMERTLNLSSIPDVNDAYYDILTEYKSVRDVKLNIATVMLINSQRPVEEDFKNVVENKYLAKVWSINMSDPEVEKKVNEFVEEETEGQIKDIIKKDSISMYTSVVLVNTLTLNATWERRFNESSTRKQEFTCHDGKKIEVDMMNDVRVARVKRDNESDADVVRMPFKGDRFALYAIIPRKYDGLPDLEERLAKSGELKKVLDDLKAAKVELSIPTFKIETKVNLEDGLKEIGMKKAFTPNVADFNGISQQGYLYLSRAVHGSVIDVDENGSSTKGATVPEFEQSPPLRGEEKEKEEKEIEVIITANKPFIFVIRDDEYNQILSQGKVTSELQ